MRVPITPEMREMQKIIEPYQVLDGVRLVLSPDAPDEIKEMHKKLVALFDEQCKLCEPI